MMLDRDAPLIRPIRQNLLETIQISASVQPIQTDNFPIRLQHEMVDQMVRDEARSARDEYAHRLASLLPTDSFPQPVTGFRIQILLTTIDHHEPITERPRGANGDPLLDHMLTSIGIDEMPCCGLVLHVTDSRGRA